MLSRRWRAQYLALMLLLVPLAVGAAQVPFSGEVVASGLSGANAAALADVNSDGALDIIGVGTVNGALAWWENADDGANWIEHPIAAVEGLTPVGVADIDGDGDPDILTASLTRTTVAWVENRANGAAWQPRVIDNDFAADSVTAADFNGDGAMDVVAGGSAETEVRWWRGNGDGTVWIPGTVVSGAQGVLDVETADIDEDGDQDVVVAASASNAILYLSNEGLGSWSTTVVAVGFTGATAVSTADVDGDGDLDVLGTSESGGIVNWWANVDGDGEIWGETAVDGAFAGANAVLGRDVDRDGDMDIMAAGSTAGEIVWWENTDVVGTEWTERKVDTGLAGPTDICFGDLDNDGDPDVVGAMSAGDEIVWWNNETVHRQSVFPIETVVNSDVPGAAVVVAYDLDQDGDLDLVGAASTGQDVRWWENEEAGTVWTERIIDGGFNGAQNIEVADIDGDGDPDVVGAAETDDRFAWWENLLGDALTWVEHEISSGALVNGAVDVDAADIDGDGDLDVIGASEIADDVSWFENVDGGGLNWIKRSVDTGADGARSATAADFDGDGDLDIIGAMANANDITWWENFDGQGGDWITRTIEGGFSGADMVAAGDIDLDGDIDVVAAGIVADDIKWWENEDGFGTTWIERTIEGNFNGATSVVATDMDADGDIDILGAADADDDIRWWENLEGNGLDWQERTTVSNFNGAEWVVFSDINNDGKPDIVGAARDAGEIAWWRNDGGQMSFDTDNSAPAAMADGELDDILAIEVIHEGREGDNEIEPVSLRILMEELDDDPLDSTEANALFESVLVYADDGSGRFEETADVLIASFTDITLTAGELDLVLPDDRPEIQVPFGAPQTLFVAVQLTEDASLQIPANFQFTHVTELSTGEDAQNDTPVEVQLAIQTTSRNVRASGTVPGLEITGICPGPVTVVVSNATVGETVSIYRAESEGNFTLTTGSCSGVELDLTSPVVVLNLFANVDGDAIAVDILNENECEDFYQALELTRCLPSNVVQSPAAPPPFTN